MRWNFDGGREGEERWKCLEWGYLPRVRKIWLGDCDSAACYPSKHFWRNLEILKSLFGFKPRTDVNISWANLSSFQKWWIRKINNHMKSFSKITCVSWPDTPPHHALFHLAPPASAVQHQPSASGKRLSQIKLKERKRKSSTLSPELRTADFRHLWVVSQ